MARTMISLFFISFLLIIWNLSSVSGPVGTVFASLQRKQFDAAQDVSRELMNIGGISGLSGPVGNVFASLFQNGMYDLPPNAATFIDCSQINGLTDGRLRDHLLHVKQLASKSTASMHVDPLILVLCFLLCFLVLKKQQQQQPQPPEQKLPAQLSQHDLDQDEQLSQHDLDQEDEHEDQEVEEEVEQFYPNAEEQFFWKDDRALWKRERGGRRHWKKRFNSHH